MAIVQISQIQIRRGLNQDLPQLASGEMGWSTDSRQLYIGNGVVGAPDYAPEIGHTEILTEHSNFLNSISNYTFAGTDSGYTSQTGPNTLTPVARTLQSVLDDIVSVRDFGLELGDGVTDNTDAINRAIQQVYPSSLNAVGASEHANVRRAIKFPAGTYVISGPIYVPPNCTLIGDGKNNTIIAATTGTAIITSDANFLVGGAMSGSLPQFICISNMRITTAAGTNAVIQIDSAIDVVFNQCYIQGPSSVVNLVNTTASTISVPVTKAVTFNGCTFDGGTNGIGASGVTNGLRIVNSTFINNLTYGINISSFLTGLVSENNYFDSSVPAPFFGMSGDNYSYGDIIPGTAGGIYSGSAKFGVGNTWVLSTGTNTIIEFASGSASMDYQLTDGTNYRFGTLKFNKPASGAASFDDDYTEPGTTMGANLFVNHNGNLTCTVSTSTIFKYNIKQFI